MNNLIKPILPILVLASIFSCSPNTSEQEKKDEKSFDEQFRPQYHFSPPQQWMNDPNGMVYLDGEYHLFYQHYPDSNVWGPMHWGHAVSKDLLHWEHLPIALYPDSLGYIFSGSAVIDHGNTTGLGENGKDPMVAIYTYHHDKDGQSQGIAFSNDKGRSWTKYSDNPVLKSPGIPDFRDPKVSWYDQGNGKGKWIMTLAVKDKISFYSSPNLIDWTHESDFNPEWAAYGGVWECPDLFPLEASNGEEKWVLLVSINPGGPNGGSATQYFTGNFDGQQFTTEGQKVKWIDYGADDYAGVTWSNIPKEDGRRLFIGWMSNWQYATIVPTTAWRSAMTLPRELELVSVEGDDRLASRPIRETKGLRSSSESIQGPTHQLKAPLFELELTKANHEKASLTLSNELGEKVVFKIDGDQLAFDRSSSGKTDFEAGFGNLHTAPLSGVDIKSLRVFADRSSLEFFINDGELVMTEIIFPNAPYLKLDFEGFNENAKVHYLASIWDH
ncbi:glycoside hydrolase family 32 protein [Echinicola strongylocentroti]|uniref:Glycoside hydrolase family 32 protein n=1 Tax=Echinicola strongylocentroti TaxID=1795355 RepID=A0A2Z4IN29_9BACT|nr:glycoside hydrolase family 32 protein [Echinicola strongylocentroti]AWW32305.1 glycoside hydrolase family 32 protein [Echinicola strongylocentroti]